MESVTHTIKAMKKTMIEAKEENHMVQIAIIIPPKVEEKKYL